MLYDELNKLKSFAVLNRQAFEVTCCTSMAYVL